MGARKRSAHGGKGSSSSSSGRARTASSGGRTNATLKPASLPSSSLSSGVSAVCLALLGVVGHRWTLSRGVAPPNRYDRLFESFPAGGKIEIAPRDGDGEMGIFASVPIRKGDVVLKIDSSNDLSATLAESRYSKLRPLVETALAPYDVNERPLVEQVMTSVLLVIESADEGSSALWGRWGSSKKEKWRTYIDALPSNVTGAAWTWTDDDLKCAVPRGAGVTASSLRQTMESFRLAFASVAKNFRPVIDLNLDPVELAQRAEWAFLMVKTRAFFAGTLKPLVDMTNHDPTRGLRPFEYNGATYLVTPVDVKAGDEIYISYGDLYPSAMAEKYAFVDPNSAYVNSPSITSDLVSRPNSRDVHQCTQGEALFFGNVTERKVEPGWTPPGARRKSGHTASSSVTTFRPFRPTQLLYQCVRVMLQTEDGPTIARYVAERVEQDAAAYKAMATAAHCQEEEDSKGVEGRTLKLIRESNALTAQLLGGVLEVARRAAAGEEDYPGISYP